MPSQSIEQLIRRIDLRTAEAVAVVQQLIASHDSDEPLPPYGPPQIDNVWLSDQGEVVCRACVATPAVSEIARLLQSMLPADAKIPGALRYTLARALLEVDARPFDSLEELSAALARHEHGDRRDTLRSLWERGAPPEVQSAPVVAVAPAPLAAVERAPMIVVEPAPSAAVEPASSAAVEPAPIAAVAPAPMAVEPAPMRTVERVPITAAEPAASAPVEPARSAAVPPARIERDRRRATPSPDELRRHLRQADVELFHARSTAPRWAVGGAMAALVAFGVGYALVDGTRHPARTSPPPPAPIAIHQTAPIGSTTLAAPSPLRSPVVSTTVAAPSPLQSMEVERPAPASHQPAVVRAVSRDVGPAFSPSFASSGTAVFFHAGRSTDHSSALETAGLADSGLRVMTILDDGSKNYHVQPSPDGSRVAFDSDRDGERGVYIANRDGTDVRRVSGDGYAAVPTWSPDGTQLAFIRAEADRPQVWNLWLLNLTTGAGRRLTAFKYGQTWNASWFADGRRVCYTHEDRLIVADLITGTTREYASPRPRTLVRTPAVSPDGRHVMFQVARSGAWLLDLADGSMRCVLADPTAEEFAWSPDGRRVAFHSRRDGQWGIWLLDPA